MGTVHCVASSRSNGNVVVTSAQSGFAPAEETRLARRTGILWAIFINMPWQRRFPRDGQSLPAGHAVDSEPRLSDTTKNKSKPMIDRITVNLD